MATEAVAADTMTLRLGARGRGRTGESGRRVAVFLLLPATLLLLLLFAYPVATVIMRSFTEPETGLQNYIWFFGAQLNVTVLLRTLATAITVTVICLLIGYPYAYLIVTTQRAWIRGVMLIAVLVPLFTSSLTRSYSWVLILQNNGVLNFLLDPLGMRVQLLGTQTAVIIGMTQVLMPFAVLPLFATMSRIDLRLISAAQSLGAPPRTAFRKIMLPLSLPGVMAAATVVIVNAMGFYITPVLLGSGSSMMLPVLVHTQVGRLLEWGRGGAMAVILLAMTLIILAVFALAFRLTNKGVFRGGIAR